ncbi:MAG: HipA domain-containing protein [Sulfurovum sp.]|nr:HipA domain-containing protein [Sulfurovaceae bacterium]
MHDDSQVKQIRTISLSGYQHKLQVIIENNTIRTPRDGEDVLYFIKPYHIEKADENSDYYFPHIAINEHLHLTFAKNELGFDVPQSGIFKTTNDKEYHYIIKYFDRLNDYKFQRKEFATYMGLNSLKKYNTSSEKLFETASKALPRESDRLRMLEYYFYSFIIIHEDMHTKNISTICDGDKTFLAPLYDIASTGFYTGIRNYESHLPINGKQTNIRYNDFLELVKRAKVDRDDFRKKATIILETYLKQMPKYIQKVSKLENIDFFTKEKPNAQGKKIKIKEKTTLDTIMMDAFHKRVEMLNKNAWFEKLLNSARV